MALEDASRGREPRHGAPHDQRYSYLHLHGVRARAETEDRGGDKWKMWDERCKQLTGNPARDVFGIADDLKSAFASKRFTRGKIEFIKSKVRACVDGKAFAPEVLAYVDALVHVLLPIAYKTSVLEMLTWLLSKFRDTIAPRTLSAAFCCLCSDHEYEGRTHMEFISKMFHESYARMDQGYLSRHMLAAHDLDILRFQFANRLLTKEQTLHLIDEMDGFNKHYHDNTYLTPYPHMFAKDMYEHNLGAMRVIYAHVGMTAEDAKRLTTPHRTSIIKEGVYKTAYLMLNPETPTQ